MNLKKSPIGSLWYGIKVATVMFSATLFWVSVIGGAVELFSDHWTFGLILLLSSVVFNLFSQSLEKSILQEEEAERKEKEKEDDDLQPPSGMNFV